MRRALLTLGLLLAAGCGVVDVGDSREAEYYARIQTLETQVEDLQKSLDGAQSRVKDLEGDERARFIDTYLLGQSSTPDAALAAWESFLTDFPESPLGPAARELRDRSRARVLERNVVENEEFRVLVDKLKTADPAQRKLLIEDFLVRFPDTSRKADLDKRLEALRQIDALKREYLGEAPAGGAATAPAATPTSPTEETPGRARVDVPVSGR